MALRHLAAVDRFTLPSFNCIILPLSKFEIILDWRKMELNFLCSISCSLLRAGLIENKDLYRLEINDIPRHTFPLISLLYELCMKVNVKFFLYTPWRGRMEMEVMRHSLLASALGGGEWSVSRPDCFTSGERFPALLIDYVVGRPSPGLNTGDENDLLSLPRVEPRLPWWRGRILVVPTAVFRLERSLYLV